MTLHRVLPPSTTRSAQLVNGRSYDPTAAAYFDVPHQDASVLAANQWTDLGPVGTTSARPPVQGPTSGNPHTATRGAMYVDTTIGAVIVFDGATWRSVLAAAAV